MALIEESNKILYEEQGFFKYQGLIIFDKEVFKNLCFIIERMTLKELERDVLIDLKDSLKNQDNTTNLDIIHLCYQLSNCLSEALADKKYQKNFIPILRCKYNSLKLYYYYKRFKLLRKQEEQLIN